jgi:hypothetical protein
MPSTGPHWLLHKPALSFLDCHLQEFEYNNSKIDGDANAEKDWLCGKSS